MCFVDIEKAFDTVPRKIIKWLLREKGVRETMVRIVMSLYEGAKTRVRVGSGLSEELPVKVGVHQGSVFLLLSFLIVVDIVTEDAREGFMNETTWP